MQPRKEQSPPLARTADAQIGQHVAELRADAGLTQAQLADRMSALGWKWKQQTCWMIEKGRQSLRLQEANDLAHVLGVTAEQFLPFGDQSDPSSKFDTSGFRRDLRNLDLLEARLLEVAREYESLRRSVALESDKPHRPLPESWRHTVIAKAGQSSMKLLQALAVENYGKRAAHETGAVADLYFESVDDAWGSLSRSLKGEPNGEHPEEA
jgi:transcriptional regulator with XRE-family HTH domain